MKTTKLQQLEAAARKSVGAARAIAEKAGTAGREMTADERREFDEAMTKSRDLLAQIQVAKADEAVLAEAKSIADSLGDAPAEDIDAQRGTDTDPRSKGRKSLGELVVGSAQFGSLLKSFGGRIPDGARVHSDPIGVKSLFTGTADASGGAFVVAEQTGIVEMLGRRPLTLRDLVSVRRTGSDTVEYVAQTAHTNAAATVAEATTSAAPTAPGGAGALILPAGGGYKPEGAWAFERRTATVKTIAEWVPATKRALADVAALEGLINDELRADLAEKEEELILNGNGVGENFTGVLATSGRQMQAFDTDILVTARKAITKARVIGRVNPTGFVFSPGDVEKIELLRDANGQFYGGGPFSATPRTLWGVPYLEGQSLADGQGVLADWKKAVLWDREQATVTMTDSHADFFIRNLVAILAEQREAFAVTRPSAVVEIDTAA